MYSINHYLICTNFVCMQTLNDCVIIVIHHLYIIIMIY